jgi:hypothetical protein
MTLERGYPISTVCRGILSLQYVDDTIIFSSASPPHVANLKYILMWYEQLFGMRIKFHKSEFIPMNIDLDCIHEVSHLFSCPVGNFPIKYLGIPLHCAK